MYKGNNLLYFYSNLFFSAVLFLSFALFNSGYRAFDLLFTLLALLSTIATVYLIYFITTRVFFNLKYTHLLLGALFLFTNIAILADFAIYRIWKFHINGMVLNILFSPASYDSLYMTSGALMVIVAALLVLVLFQYFAYTKIEAMAYERVQKANRMISAGVVPLLFLIIAFEKVSYAVANLKHDSYILERTKVIPLYQPLLMDDFLVDAFHMKKAHAATIEVRIDKITNIRYPLKPIRLEGAQTPNIFIFGIDALRSDVISKDVTPNLYDFAQSSLFFADNKSGGNNTRFGLFSLFYGINSSYWFGFLNAQKGPVFFDVLRKLDYQMGIISSVNMEWPEFRKTAFIDVQDHLRDDFEGTPLQRDEQAIDAFMSWIDAQDARRPIFSFLWFDSVHSRSYDDTYRKFLPDDAGNDYLTVERADMEKQFNRYKNSALCVDEKFRRFIDKLKEKNLYENSIIVVVSDHGQEFFEYGMYGHNSAYNVAQVNAALMIRMPHIAPKMVQTQTSSLDLVPTLLKRLGVTNAIGDYSHGMDLLDPAYERHCSFVGNWNENAIVCDDYTVIMPDVISKQTEVRDTKSYKKVTDYDAAKINGLILKTLDENRRFLK
jgi:membrane-anchored protein YejM (alkaline phosphatase superfamily)